MASGMAPYKHNPGAPLDPSRTCTGTHIYISIHRLFWCCLPLLHLATFMLYRTWIVVQQPAQQNSIKSTVTRMYMMRIAQCMQLLAAFGEAKTI